MPVFEGKGAFIAKFCADERYLTPALRLLLLEVAAPDDSSI